LSGAGVLVRVVSTSGSPPGWGRPRRIGGPVARPLTGRGPHPRTITPAQTDAPKVTTGTSGRTARASPDPGRSPRRDGGRSPGCGRRGMAASPDGAAAVSGRPGVPAAVAAGKGQRAAVGWGLGWAGGWPHARECCD